MVKVLVLASMLVKCWVYQTETLTSARNVGYAVFFDKFVSVEKYDAFLVLELLSRELL